MRSFFKVAQGAHCEVTTINYRISTGVYIHLKTLVFLCKVVLIFLISMLSPELRSLEVDFQGRKKLISNACFISSFAVVKGRLVQFETFAERTERTPYRRVRMGGSSASSMLMGSYADRLSPCALCINHIRGTLIKDEHLENRSNNFFKTRLTDVCRNYGEKLVERWEEVLKNEMNALLPALFDQTF